MVGTHYLATSTGKKFLMGFSGAALVGFIIGHLVGNLQIFAGPEALNRYSAFLKSTGELLWIARLGLLAMVFVHIWTAIAITVENRAARLIPYARKDFIKASYASRTMHISGFLVLAYLIYHLMHFTFHWAHPQFSQYLDSSGRPDVYRMVVLSFQQPSIAITYILANLMLGGHLSHGLYSMCQSLGAVKESMRPKLQVLSNVLGYGIFIGYAAIPLSVWLGIVK